MKAFFQELFRCKPFHLLDNHMGQESSLFCGAAKQPTQDTEKVSNFSTVTQLVTYLDAEAAKSRLRGRSLVVMLCPSFISVVGKKKERKPLIERKWGGGI